MLLAVESVRSRRMKLKIRSFASTMDSMTLSKGHKVMRLAMNDKFNEAVYQCFFQKRSLDMPISGPILCEKAIQLHER